MPPANRACRRVALRFFRALCHGKGIRRVCDPQVWGLPSRSDSWLAFCDKELSDLAVSYTREHKSEPVCRNHREGAPQRTKCCLGGSEERSKVSIVACRDAYLWKQARGACSTFCSTCNEAPPRITHCKIESSPPRTTNLEPEREFPPYFKRSTEMGGQKRAVNLR